MAKLQPKDKVEWRAGATLATFHVRRGVIKEIIDERIALVRTKVEGESRVEEIRLARLTKVEEPKKPRRRKKKKARKAVSKKGRKRRTRKKKATKKAAGEKSV